MTAAKFGEVRVFCLMEEECGQYPLPCSHYGRCGHVDCNPAKFSAFAVLAIDFQFHPGRRAAVWQILFEQCGDTVVLRVSRSPASGQLKAYYPYEEKVYWSQAANVSGENGGITFREIWTMMGNNA